MEEEEEEKEEENAVGAMPNFHWTSVVISL